MQKIISSKKIKKWAKKNNIIDIVLFGSAARGKSIPADIDLCIIINDSDEAKSIDFVDSLKKETGKRYHINILTAGEVIKGNTLSKILLQEGFSIVNGFKFCEIFGLHNASIFTYSLKGMSPSKRVSFHYLLKGRNKSKGIMESLGAKYMGDGSMIVMTEKEDALKEIFNAWHLNFEIRRVLMS